MLEPESCVKRPLGHRCRAQQALASEAGSSPQQKALDIYLHPQRRGRLAGAESAPRKCGCLTLL